MLSENFCLGRQYLTDVFRYMQMKTFKFLNLIIQLKKKNYVSCPSGGQFIYFKILFSEKLALKADQ